MTRISFLLLCCCVSIMGIAQKKSTGKKPNIIYIMSDDHTSQAWGLYGGVLKGYVKNDNIKKLAAGGAVLNNAFCTNSICVPSRATVLTGEYSNSNGVYTLGDGLDPEKNNIAKELRRAGYQTGVFGKWHLKTKPSGFDTFNVLPGHGVYHNPVYLDKDNWNDKENGTHGKKYTGFVDDVTTDMSLGWIKNRDTSKPFFLMCYFKATHEPFDFPERYKNLFADVEFPYPAGFLDSGAATTGRSFRGQPLEELGARYTRASKGAFWTTYPELPFSIEGLSPLEARKKIYQKFIKDYLRCAAAIDDNIGKLMNFLKASGLDSNTVIIYTSDQGYFLGEHAFMDKRMMYEESLRMPFVISYPKEIKPGIRINDMVLNTDFAALFADYAGFGKPENIQGESFRKNLQGKTPKNWRSSMYYRYWEHTPVRPAHLGIRNQRYKLIYFYGLPLGMKQASKETTAAAWEFFDLQKDPQELHNAINDKQYAAIISSMKKELWKLKQEAGDSDEARPEMQALLQKEMK